MFSYNWRCYCYSLDKPICLLQIGKKKKNLYKRSGEITCCFGSNTSLLKSSGELDLSLFFWNICCLPGELSGSTCQPARSQQVHMAVPCSGLVPRDPSETREMSQGTNPLKHFLKSNGGNKTSSHHKTKADKRWNVFKSC